MRARFLLGRAGSGKTHKCLDEIREALLASPAGPPLLFLVPEQATYQMDRALLSRVPGGASARASIVSFRRLSFRLLNEVGGQPRRLIGDLGRQMLVHALLIKNAESLRLFKASAMKPGLLAHLSKMIQELRQYAVEPEDLQLWLDSIHSSAGSDSLLALKLLDLHRIYDGYRARCREDIHDAEDLPDLCNAAAAQSRWLADAKVWVDSFSDFTKQELGILRTLAGQVNQITFALALDPADLPTRGNDQARPFAKAEKTHESLRRLLPEQAECELIHLPEERQLPRFRNHELAHLEATFLTPRRFPGIPAPVKLVEAANRRAEVDACARAIMELVRDRGYRFRDIAVIVRELGSYHDLIEAVFADHGISFFIDQRRSMAHHALVELIRCAVRVVCEDWTHDYVIPYLRTQLAPVGTREIDVLDNYALEHGITGKAWYDGAPWAFQRRDAAGDGEANNATLNVARRKGLEALCRFQNRLAAGKGANETVRVHQAVDALSELLDELKVADTLDEWRQQAEADGHFDTANEHVQVWDAVADLLHELVEALGEEPLTVSAFADILEAGLASITLGLIPPTLDCVLIGSIERSRQPDIKAAFILGLVERQFPMVGDEDPILTDSDRTHSAESGIELGPTSEQRFYHERYLGYVAVTRASEILWLSYPIADDAGRTLNPSPFVEVLRTCFPELAPIMAASGLALPRLDRVSSAREFAGGLVQHLSPGRECSERNKWLAAYDQLKELPDVQALVAEVLPSLSYANQAKLSPSAARALFEEPLRCSVSRLETFAACAFQHFVHYGLRLRPRRDYRIEAHDLGHLYHEALKYFFEQTRDQAWATLDWRDAERIIDAAVDQEATRLRNEILLTTARNRYIRDQSRRHLKRFMRTLLEHARNTQFQPVAAEFGFGTGDGLPELELSLGDGRCVKLNGRIDRVDTVVNGGNTFVRTVDYKTSSQTLNLAEVFHGLDLQLLTYLLVLDTPQAAVALGLRNPVAAAAFYSVLTKKITSAVRLGDQVNRAETDSPYKLRGVFRADIALLLDSTPDLQGYSALVGLRLNKDGKLCDHNRMDVVDPELLSALLACVRERILGHARDILDGKVEVAPADSRGPDPCGLCDFRSVCRFERPFNSARVFPPLSKIDVLNRLEKAFSE